MEERCNVFAAKGIKDPNWAFNSIVKSFSFKGKERGDQPPRICEGKENILFI
jgi:hypothetical protein